MKASRKYACWYSWARGCPGTQTWVKTAPKADDSAAIHPEPTNHDQIRNGHTAPTSHGSVAERSSHSSTRPFLPPPSSPPLLPLAPNLASFAKLLDNAYSTPPGMLPPPAPPAAPCAAAPAVPLQPSAGLACLRSMNIGFRPSLSSCLKSISGFSSRPRQRSWSPWTM